MPDLTFKGDRNQSVPTWAWTAVASLMALNFLLAFSSAIDRDIYVDEQVDHEATLDLLENPLRGGGINGSQARLPHYWTLLTYRIVEIFTDSGMDRFNLTAARATSSLAMALTVIVTFLIANRAAGLVAGLLAAGTLSIAPYTLGFGSLAYTNGDAFCPLFATATVWAYVRSVDLPTGRHLVILAFCIGLAVASKLLLVMLLPGLVLSDLLTRRRPVNASGPEMTSARLTHPWLLLTAIGAFVFSIGTAIITRFLADESGNGATLLRTLTWLAAVALTCHGFFKLRSIDASQLNWLMRWTLVLPLAAAVSLAFFPEHVFHPNVFKELFGLASVASSNGPFSNIRQFLLLYGGIVLLKLGLPLGVFSGIAIIHAVAATRRQFIARAMVLTGASYVFLLFAQPLRQTFYLVTIYPLLVVMLSVTLVTAWQHVWKGARPLLLVAVVVSYGWLLVDIVRVYPNFLLYGYETVGPNWRGYETRGFLSLCFIDQDGKEEALKWCTQNLPAQSRVVSCLRLVASVQRIVKADAPAFEFIQLDWPWDRRKDADWETIRSADYVIIHLNNWISDRATPTREQLGTVFDPSPIHVVHMGRGDYRIPVVEIFKRKPKPAEP